MDPSFGAAMKHVPRTPFLRCDRRDVKRGGGGYWLRRGNNHGDREGAERKIDYWLLSIGQWLLSGANLLFAIDLSCDINLAPDLPAITNSQQSTDNSQFSSPLRALVASVVSIVLPVLPLIHRSHQQLRRRRVSQGDRPALAVNFQCA